MPDSQTNPPSPGQSPQPDPVVKVQSSPIFTTIINELNLNQDQLQKRQKLIVEIEKLLSARFGTVNRLMSYVLRFGRARTSMGSADIPSLEATLNSVSGADQINLLLHSPGGDATIIEKMVDMSRAHLSGQHCKFRVIVPNIAKSAATVLALGSDEILMGYCSELGPIDPQVQIAVSGVIQWVSAFAFVESRDKLMKQVEEAAKKKKPTVGLLQQLAGLNIPYTNEMENWIGFSKKTAATLLDKYMLKPKFPDAKVRKKNAERIAQKLLSKQLFPVHGQFIDGMTAKNELGLEVEVLDKADKLWEMIWEYYIRCEVQMNIPIQTGVIKTKLFESSSSSLVGHDTGDLVGIVITSVAMLISRGGSLTCRSRAREAISKTN